MLDEITKQLELSSGQVHCLVVSTDQRSAKVYSERSELMNICCAAASSRGIRRGSGPSQEGFNSSEKLHHRKRFREIVVGAKLLRWSSLFFDNSRKNPAPANSLLLKEARS